MVDIRQGGSNGKDAVLEGQNGNSKRGSGIVDNDPVEVVAGIERIENSEGAAGGGIPDIQKIEIISGRRSHIQLPG